MRCTSDEDLLQAYKKEKNLLKSKEFMPYEQSRSVDASLPKYKKLV